MLKRLNLKLKSAFQLTLIIAAILPLQVIAQLNVYLTYDDYLNKVNYKTYEKLKPSDDKSILLLIDQNSEKIKIPRDSVWGYTQMVKGEEKLTVVFDRKKFEVDAIHDKIIIYQYFEKSTFVAGNAILTDYKVKLHFGTSFNHKPVPLTKENFKTEYTLTESQSKTLEELYRQKRFQKKNKKTNQYFIIEKVFEPS